MPKDDEDCRINLLRMEEGCIRDGKRVPGRISNGGRQRKLKLADTLTCLKVKVYKH